MFKSPYSPKNGHSRPRPRSDLARVTLGAAIAPRIVTAKCYGPRAPPRRSKLHGQAEGMELEKECAHRSLRKPFSLALKIGQLRQHLFEKGRTPKRPFSSNAYRRRCRTSAGTAPQSSNATQACVNPQTSIFVMHRWCPSETLSRFRWGGSISRLRAVLRSLGNPSRISVSGRNLARAVPRQ